MFGDVRALAQPRSINSAIRLLESSAVLSAGRLRILFFFCRPSQFNIMVSHHPYFLRIPSSCLYVGWSSRSVSIVVIVIAYSVDSLTSNLGKSSELHCHLRLRQPSEWIHWRHCKRSLATELAGVVLIPIAGFGALMWCLCCRDRINGSETAWWGRTAAQ
jgi:hypothetical protein